MFMQVQKDLDMAAMSGVFEINADHFVKLHRMQLTALVGRDEADRGAAELRAKLPTTWVEALKIASVNLDRCYYVDMCVKDHHLFWQDGAPAPKTVRVCGWPGCTEARYHPKSNKPRAKLRLWKMEERIKRAWSTPVLARHMKYGFHRQQVLS